MIAPGTLLTAVLLGAEAPVLIAVPELTPLGVSADMAQNLTAVVAAELGRYDNVRALSSREIGMLLGVERQKALLGCADDSCVAQLAGALGADKILGGQIGLIEQSIVLTLQLTDVKSSRVDGRQVKVVPAGKNQIVDAVRAAVTALMGNASSKNQLPRVAVRESLVAHQNELVSLDASRCYDPDGDPLQTEWRQLDGPPALLEGAHEGLATFTASETGHYTFRVSVTDGRSTPVVQKVEVEVLKRRPFVMGVGFQIFGAFNRYVLTDGAGGHFRNRTPYGPRGELGLWLSDDWQLLGIGELGFMHTFTNEDLAATVGADIVIFNVIGKLRRYFSFGPFRLFLGATLGYGRLFLRLQDHDNVQNVGTQSVLGELGVGVDLPLGERFGITTDFGFRVQGNTEAAPRYPGIDFTFSDGGLFWGLHVAVAPYLRL